LSVEEFKGELNLMFKRFSSKNNNESGEEKALFVTQFKVKYHNYGKIGYKAVPYKSRQVKDDKNDVT
jgi:hypothetical protein